MLFLQSKYLFVITIYNLLFKITYLSQSDYITNFININVINFKLFNLFFHQQSNYAENY